MPTIETDMIFAFLNENDHHHETSSKLFAKITSGFKVELPSSALIEMELIYKSEGRETDLIHHVGNLITVPNMTTVPLTPETILLAIKLREDYGLSFFDSHHAASALQGDGKIIGTDQAFKRVKALEVIDPHEITETDNNLTDEGK